MSWIDKELKKRAKSAPEPLPSTSAAETAAEMAKMADLWSAIEAANQALPAAIRLKPAIPPAANPMVGTPAFVAWYQAGNGAGLGFTGDAVRYVWPERSHGSSNNFWIRWLPHRGYLLQRRGRPSDTGAPVIERRFNATRVNHILKCLVVGKRVTPRAVRIPRLWLF